MPANFSHSFTYYTTHMVRLTDAYSLTNAIKAEAPIYVLTG